LPYCGKTPRPGPPFPKGITSESVHVPNLDPKRPPPKSPRRSRSQRSVWSPDVCRGLRPHWPMTRYRAARTFAASRAFDSGTIPLCDRASSRIIFSKPARSTTLIPLRADRRTTHIPRPGFPNTGFNARCNRERKHRDRGRRVKCAPEMSACIIFSRLSTAFKLFCDAAMRASETARTLSA